jgi:hypothetical protein
MKFGKGLRTFSLFVLFSSGHLSEAADYTPGDYHNYTHASGTVPDDVYQYSVYVPKDYDPKKSYPLVLYLHGGGKGKTHPDQGKRNLVASRLIDNDRKTDAGYSRHDPQFVGYILVSPVKPIATWGARKFGRLLKHVQSKVNVDDNRIYVTGFSMGGQGTWHVGCGTNVDYKIAAMMPLGAWGCNYVRRGKTPETCQTLQTPVWVLHCPQDNVSMITEQFALFDSHLKNGGYGRFTMIPGRGHISRGRNDHEFFGLRMGWMLSQTYGTPFNYMTRLNDGKIAKVAKGDRPYTGDTSGFGFYEPGTVLEVTADETKNGKPFVKWTCHQGELTDASARSTRYTTTANDVVISAIYGEQTAELIVTGGTATPAAPTPGQQVTVTANSDSDGNRFAYWEFSSDTIEIPVPTSRTIRFAMPATTLNLSAQNIESLPKRKR